MDPLVRGAALCGALSLVALVLAPPARAPASGPASGPAAAAQPSPASATAPGASATPGPATSKGGAPATPCPPRSLPEDDPAGGRVACLALPPLERAPRSARLDRLAERGSLAPPLRLELRSEAIARLPDRPESYAAYQLPVAGEPAVSAAEPSDWGTLGPSPAPPLTDAEPLRGVRIEAAAGSPVVEAPLDRQQGATDVVLVGELYGITVVTHATLESQSGLRDYLVLYGHLARPGPEVVNGSRLAPGAIIGYVGDRGGSDVPHLYLEVRQLRRGAKLQAAHLSELVRPSVSIPCDPRNVLPMK